MKMFLQKMAKCLLCKKPSWISIKIIVGMHFSLSVPPTQQFRIFEFKMIMHCFTLNDNAVFLCQKMYFNWTQQD